MKLHVVSRPGRSHCDLEAASRLAPGCLLLVEDAVVTAVRGNAADAALRGLLERGTEVHVLSEDLAARGIRPERLVPGVKVVDYDGFVRLVEAHEVVPWL